MGGRNQATTVAGLTTRMKPRRAYQKLVPICYQSSSVLAVDRYGKADRTRRRGMSAARLGYAFEFEFELLDLRRRVT